MNEERDYRQVRQLINKNDFLISLKNKKMDLQSMNKDMLIKFIQTCRQDLEEENKKYKRVFEQLTEAKVNISMCKECDKLICVIGQYDILSIQRYFCCYSCTERFCLDHAVTLSSYRSQFFCSKCSTKALQEGWISK